MSIHVHIERLIVDGLDLGPGGAIDLQASVQARLTELLTEHGLTRQDGKTWKRSASTGHTIAIERTDDAATIGFRAAESLHTGISPDLAAGSRKTNARQ